MPQPIPPPPTLYLCAQVYIETWPYLTGTALALLAILASAAALAWLDSQPRAARLLAALTAVLALCLWAGCCRAQTLFIRGYRDALAQLAELAAAQPPLAAAPPLLAAGPFPELAFSG